MGKTTHTKTRKCALVHQLYELYLSISYDRVLDISTELGNKICHYYSTVIPPWFKHGLFTTAAVDNIDHNLSSTSAQDSFHGTGISMFQHPDENNPGTDRPIPSCTDIERKRLYLPDTYTTIPPATLVKKNPPSVKEFPSKSDSQLISHALLLEYR